MPAMSLEPFIVELSVELFVVVFEFVVVFVVVLFSDVEFVVGFVETLLHLVSYKHEPYFNWYPA